MRIITMNGKYYLLADAPLTGCVLHSENTLTEMQAYCAEKWAASLESIIYDNTTAYHDDEKDIYITDDMLITKFDNDYALIEQYGTFAGFMNKRFETLTRIK